MNSEEADHQPNDWLLLEAWRQGDEEAARQFYERYLGQLMSLVQRHIAQRFSSRFDADDVVQSVMRTVFRKAHQGNLLPSDSDELWRLLSVIALNKVRNRVRKESRQKNDASRDVVDVELLNRLSDPLEQDAVETADLIESIAETLAPPVRDTLNKLLEGQDPDDIATSLGVTTRSVRRYREEIIRRLETVLASN